VAIVHAVAEDQLIEIVRQAEAGYPEEICGIVIGEPGVPETYQVHQVKNVANQHLQKDTTGNDRDARTAYYMDGLEMLGIEKRADEAGLEFVMFYHSHPDHDAYFSAMDRDRALSPFGEPLWLGANYLVVSVRGARARDWLLRPLDLLRRLLFISVPQGRARDARYYVWDDARKDFVEVAATLPAQCR
jgi:proteasome lid subunit RPN8/RPN11